MGLRLLDGEGSSDCGSSLESRRCRIGERERERVAVGDVARFVFDWLRGELVKSVTNAA